MRYVEANNLLVTYVTDWDDIRKICAWIAVRQVRLRASAQKNDVEDVEMALSGRLRERINECGRMGVPPSVSSRRDARYMSVLRLAADRCRPTYSNICRCLPVEVDTSFEA